MIGRVRCICAIFYLICTAVTPAAAAPKPDPEIAIFLKSGEIIKGKLIEKTPEAVIIDKAGNKLSFKFSEIMKLEDAESGQGLPIKYTLPFSTAIITYNLNGYQKGKETAYIDAANNKLAIETSAVMQYSGLSAPMNNIQIYADKKIYTVDLEHRSCMVMEWEDTALTDIFGEPLYLGRPVERGSFLGKDCNVYKTQDGKAYFWNGILLKKQVKEGGSFDIAKEAVDIKLDVAIPAEKFKVPAGIEVKTLEQMTKDVDQQAKKYQQQMMDEVKTRLGKDAESNPQTKKMLAQITKPDGTLDLEKYYQLLQQDSDKQMIEDVKTLDGGPQVIREATSADGRLDTEKIRDWYYKKQSEKYEAESAEHQKKELLRKAQTSPEYEKILKECKNKDGSFDIKKARGLMQEQEQKELLANVRKLTDGEELIRKATTSLGNVDQFRLQSLYYEKRRGLEEKAREMSDAGRAYEAEKKYDLALQKFTEAIQVDPLYAHNYFERARIYELKGDDQRALTDLNALISETRGADAYYYSHRGDIYVRLGKYNEAITDYTKALDMESASELAALSARKEALKKVGEDADKIVAKKLPSQSTYTLEKRAKAYYKAGKNQNAIDDLSKIIENGLQDSRLGDAYFLRGLIYRQMKKTDQMKADWQKAESLGDKLVEGGYVQGCKQGEFVWYYADGPILAKALYVNNKKNGEFVRYYRSGQISKKGVYKDDKLEGLYTCFAPSGKKSEEGTYKNDKKEGVFITYDPVTGAAINRMNYIDGELR